MYTFSIVIPVYNASKYIKRCIDSILGQSFTSFEVIVVDDGSSDDSYRLLRNYETQYQYIRVIRQTNAGVSAARNRGLKESKGDYVVFVDIDDYLDKSFLEDFLFEKSWPDIVIQGYTCWTKSGNYKRQISIDSNKNSSIIAECESNYLLNSPWAKAFKRSILFSNSLFFDETISYGEDHIFVLSFLQYVDCIYVSKGCGYNYIDNQGGSLSNKIIPVESNCQYALKVNELEMSLNSKYNNDSNITEAFNLRHYYNIIKICLDCKTSENKEGILKARRLLKGLANPFCAGYKLRQRLFLLLFRYANPKLVFKAFYSVEK